MNRKLKQGSVFSLVALTLAVALSLLAFNESTKPVVKAANNSKIKLDIVPAEVKGELRTELNTNVAYIGEFKGSGSSVKMRSKQTGFDGKLSPKTPKSSFKGMSSPPPGSVTKANFIKTSLTVNGKRIDIQENLNKGTIRFNPHSQVLTEDDLIALSGAYYDFEGTLIPRIKQSRRETEREPWSESRLKEHPRLDSSNFVNPQDDLLIRTLILLSEAPIGLPLEQTTISQPDPEEIQIEPLTGQAAVNASSENISTQRGFIGNQSGGLAEAACEDKENFISIELVACRNPNDNEFYIHTCKTTVRTTQHDDGKHCFKTFWKKSGPRTSSCMGRCGKGCGRSNGYGLYTLDCLDHDHVVGHVGYFALRAQDEFNWTKDDVYYSSDYRRRFCRR